MHRDARTSLRVSVSRLLLALQDFRDGGGPRGPGGLLLPVELSLALQQFSLKPVKTLIRKSLDPEETINADLGEIEFDQVARAMGAHGERVADPAGLEGALKRSVASGRCAVIHVDVDPVKHMWAPNLKTFKDMHLEPSG